VQSKSRRQYLVAPNTKAGAGPGDLLEFIEASKKSRDVAIASIAGDVSSPTRVIIEASDRAVAFLKERFGSRLIIEPNSDLALFS
jgi:hypothetical protein